jgi:hypothetical protein
LGWASAAAAGGGREGEERREGRTARRLERVVVMEVRERGEVQPVMDAGAWKERPPVGVGDVREG